MTSPILRIVASALRLQGELETAREWAATYAEERNLYRREAHHWRAKAAALSRELAEAREMAAHYAGDSGTAWDEAGKLNRMVWHLRGALDAANEKIALERARHAETQQELEKIEGEYAATYQDWLIDIGKLEAARAELGALRAAPQPRAHMDFGGER